MKTFATVLAVAVLVVPSVGAVSVDNLSGTIGHRGTILAGDVEIQNSEFSAALYAVNPGHVARQTFELTAANVVLNRTYEVRLGVGTSPTNPSSYLAGYPTGQGSDEATFIDPVILASGDHNDVGLLVLPARPGSAQVRASNASGTSADAARSETWAVGSRGNGNRVNASAPNQANPLDRYYIPRLTDITFDTQSPIHLVVQGNFIVTLWGHNATVVTGGDEEHYRSGRWDENITTAKRDRYSQLIELRVTDGTLHVDTQAGRTRWNAPEAQVETTGATTFTRAEGTLHAADEVIQLAGQDFRVVGTMGETIRRGITSPLESMLEAQGADVNVAPIAAAGPTMIRQGGLAILLVSVLVAVLLAVAAVFLVRHIRLARDWSVVMTKAQEAMLDRDWGRSFQLSHKLLYREAPRPEWKVDPWFVHSASRMELGDFDWILREVPPQMEDLQNPPTLAYLLTLAAVKTGDLKAARKWGRLFRDDPETMAAFLKDPATADFRAQLGYGTSSSLAGYA